MTPTWATGDGSVRLFNADCMSVLPFIAADAIVTDPNYGIGEARANNASRSCLAESKDYGVEDWDDKPCSPEQIAAMRSVAPWQVIFGGNYFNLPPTSCYLVWDKLNGNNDFADCELAWTNLKKAVRRIQFRWHGMIRDEECERVHPTQKPVTVMRWAMSHLPIGVGTICDPFMGSGTTGIACLRDGRHFIGIEKNAGHFANAVKRIESELNRAPLFDESPAIVQRELI